MNITGRQKVVATAAIAAAILALWALWPSGPSYQGRSMKSWFYDRGENDTEAFRAMGSAGVPFLIERLEDAPSERVTLLVKLSIVSKESYRQNKVMWQHRAAYLLGEMGTAAQKAEPKLAKAATSENWSLRGGATVALMKIRQESPDSLIEQLRDTSDPQAWYQTGMMVGQFGAQSEPAVPILLEALQHTNNVIQAHALIALGMIARQPDKCIPAIVPFLTSPNVSDRQKAIGALLAYRTNALPATDAIQKALSDSDPWVRSDAAAAMKILQQ
ncbi:MAG: HEAT repeat domain-containing protein [Verrucomicrobia bacterium]|nr:HEAT repeat domain-containing protein [Verrucomicrobiota bacterium]